MRTPPNLGGGGGGLQIVSQGRGLNGCFISLGFRAAHTRIYDDKDYKTRRWTI